MASELTSPTDPIRTVDHYLLPFSKGPYLFLSSIYYTPQGIEIHTITHI